MVSNHSGADSRYFTSSRANDLLRAVRGNVANIDAARKRVQSVDIAFLIDCTGSMQHWIDRTKDTVMDILDRLRGLYPEAQLRTVNNHSVEAWAIPVSDP